MSANPEQTNEPEFVKKRISLTKRHANKLEKCANEHHSGNQSRCIRNAIDDHARVLDGQNELNVEKVRQTVDTLQSEFEELKSDLGEISTHQDAEDRSEERSAPINPVQKALLSADSPLTPSELADRLDISRARAIAAAEELVDKGQLSRAPDELPEYQLSR